MSEEFKPIRITLSEEAYDRMEHIMKGANFRSYSSTIEECVRAVSDLIKEVYIVAGEPGDSLIHPTTQDCLDALNRMIMRLSRFTGRTPARRTQ